MLHKQDQCGPSLHGPVHLAFANLTRRTASSDTSIGAVQGLADIRTQGLERRIAARRSTRRASQYTVAGNEHAENYGVELLGDSNFDT